MKAMILAAGKGTRVRPLTNLLPKPMIPVLGRPVMEYLVHLLKKHGFNELMVNTSYLAPQIEDYFRDGERFGVRIGYSFEGERLQDGSMIDAPIGSAGGLVRIQDHSGFFDSTFVVLCGDAIIDLDLSAVLAFHREKGALATIVCKRVPKAEVSSYGVVVSDPSGRVRSFQEKPKPEDALSDLVNTGIYVFEPAVLDRVPRGVTYDIGSQLFPALVKEDAGLFAVEAEFRWVDIGNTPDYWKATQFVLNEARDLAPPQGVEVRPGVWAGLNVSADWDRLNITAPVVVGSSCRLETGAVIVGPTVIGSGCVVEAGARIERSVIFDYTRVSRHATLVDSVVAGQWCVSQEGAVIDLAASDLGWVIDDSRRRVTEGAVSPFAQDKE